jgi:hypothetical protein
LLKQPYIDAIRIPDDPPKHGCGWTNSVKFSEIGDVKMSVKPLTCEMAAALTLWVAHELQGPPHAKCRRGRRARRG